MQFHSISRYFISGDNIQARSCTLDQITGLFSGHIHPFIAHLFRTTSRGTGNKVNPARGFQPRCRSCLSCQAGTSKLVFQPRHRTFRLGVICRNLIFAVYEPVSLRSGMEGERLRLPCPHIPRPPPTFPRCTSGLIPGQNKGVYPTSCDRLSVYAIAATTLFRH